MGALVIPIGLPHLTQPAFGPLELDPSNPLTQGLVVAMVGSDGGTRLGRWSNLADPMNSTTPGSGTPAQEHSGIGMGGKNTSVGSFQTGYLFPKASSGAVPTSGFVFLKRNAAQANMIARARSGSDTWLLNGTGNVVFVVNASTRFTSSTGIANGAFAMIGYTASNANGYTGYLNGLFDGNGAGGFGNFATFNDVCGGGSAGSSIDSLLLVLQWQGRELTQLEHYDLSLNPWQVLAPQTFNVVVPTTSGATAKPWHYYQQMHRRAA